MQSTGQGATHSSQPVHSGSTTVCICLAAPTMASTGQAWMHSVQPMQVLLVDDRDRLGLLDAVLFRERLELAPEQVGELADAPSPPGGHWLISASPLAMASA
jgi:hypothetical protein